MLYIRFFFFLKNDKITKWNVKFFKINMWTKIKFVFLFDKKTANFNQKKVVEERKGKNGANCKLWWRWKRRTLSFRPRVERLLIDRSFTSFLSPSLFLYIYFHTSPSSLCFYTSTNMFCIHIPFLFVGISRLLDICLYIYMHKMLVSFMNISRVSMHWRQILLRFGLSAMWSSVTGSVWSIYWR